MLGEEVARIFLNQINDTTGAYPLQDIVLPPQLIIRESSLKKGNYTALG